MRVTSQFILFVISEAYWVILSNTHAIELFHIFLLEILSLPPISGLAILLQPKSLSPSIPVPIGIITDPIIKTELSVQVHAN